MSGDGRRGMVWALVLLLAGGVAYAQDAPAPETPSESSEPAAGGDRRGTWQLDVEDWIAQPAGVGFIPAVRMSGDPLYDEALEVEHGTSDGLRYRLGYSLNSGAGELLFTYWSHADDQPWGQLNAGNYNLYATMVAPTYAGVNNDGLSDGVTAQADTSTRDVRLDFARRAFDGPRMRGRWFVGLRWVDHDRVQSAQYLALVSPLPPVLPPLPYKPELDPTPDSGAMTSRFSGRGVEAGFELQFPIVKRFQVDAGMAFAVLRGLTDVRYASTTHAYAIVDGDTVVRILEPPYSEFEQLDESGSPLINTIQQIAFTEGVNSQSLSTDASVLETWIGARWNAWRGLDVFAGFRNTRYADAGMEVRRVDGFDFEDERVSVDYEGYFLGVGYRY